MILSVFFSSRAATLGQKTQNVLEKFRPVLQKALNDYISETMNDKIKTALGGSGGSVSIQDSRPPETETSAETPAGEEKRTRTS